MFRAERPWGFILFARNVQEHSQLLDLVADLRDCVDRPNAPVLIDQEGGRVQRIKPPLAPVYPPGALIGSIYSENPDAGLRAAWAMGRLHAFDLSTFGINVNCIPVLDVPVKGVHDVIGNRALAADPHEVAKLGKAMADGLMAGGVLPVMKHMPGHGRALVDSHLGLPKVDAPLEELEAVDFVPFRALNEMPMGMTAHMLFTAIDPDHPATSSAIVINQIIRGKLGFDGLLMTDDLSMKALSGDFAAKTDAIFKAGCDVVLHCNGLMQEMTEVSSRTPVLSGASARRADRVMSLFGAGDETDQPALRAEFDNLVAEKMLLV